MNKIIEILNQIDLNFSLLMAGALGGLIGIKKNQPWYRSVISVIVGAIIANYSAPLIIHLFSMDENTLGGIGFVCGYSGKHLLEAVMTKLTKKITE
jgi:hypothetical protein